MFLIRCQKDGSEFRSGRSRDVNLLCEQAPNLWWLRKQMMGAASGFPAAEAGLVSRQTGTKVHMESSRPLRGIRVKSM